MPKLSENQRNLAVVIARGEDILFWCGLYGISPELAEQWQKQPAFKKEVARIIAEDEQKEQQKNDARVTTSQFLQDLEALFAVAIRQARVFMTARGEIDPVKSRLVSELIQLGASRFHGSH